MGGKFVTLRKVEKKPGFEFSQDLNKIARNLHPLSALDS